MSEYDILSYRGKLYYRNALYNGLNVINPNYEITLILEGE